MGRSRLALLHLCDSLFPVGAFAHSDGLEQAVDCGRVAAAGDLREWLLALLDVLRGFEAPVVREAMSIGRGAAPSLIRSLSVDCDAMRPSRSARDASRTMGLRLLKTWQQIRPHPALDAVLAAGGPFAFPVAFGTVAAAADVDPAAAIEGYCYMRLASTVSAAMRLLPVGQTQAHQLLADALQPVPDLAAAVAADAAPPRAFMPLMDVATMSHRHVHSRLFRS